MNPNDFTTEDVLKFAKRDAAQKGQSLQTEFTFTENALGFYHAVNWKEDWWIYVIFAMHVLLLCLVVASRKAEVQLQGMVFLLIVSLTAGASTLNALAHKNYHLFSTQDYFDRRGTFASVIWTGPLILILLLQLIFMVKLTADLAVKAGRMKVRINSKKKSKKGSGDDNVEKKKVSLIQKKNE
jgi:transmembrane protein 18